MLISGEGLRLRAEENHTDSAYTLIMLARLCFEALGSETAVRSEIRVICNTLLPPKEYDISNNTFQFYSLIPWCQVVKLIVEILLRGIVFPTDW